MMLKNYLVTAYRNLLKNKFYSAINILGLAIGLTGVITIAVFIQYEMSYDTMYEKHDRIYRVSREKKNLNTGTSLHRANLAGIAAPLLKQDFPEIEDYVRIFHGGTTALVQRGDIRINESKINYVDPQIFDIFDYKFISGDPKTALVDKGSVVITRSIAKKYFGDDDPMGQTLNIFRAGDVKVTGVIEDLPRNTIISSNMFITIHNSNPVLNQRWFLDIPHTFILLAEGADISSLQTKLGDFMDRHAPKTEGQQDILHTWKLTDIYFHSHLAGEFKENGDLQGIYMFAAIALFLLIIASINFMNLSTARSALRAKEVAVRKVIGARNPQIVAQFLAESVLITVIAVIIAVTLVELGLPWLNDFADVDMAFNYLSDWQTGLSLLVLTLLVGLAAGSYPAFYLSAYRPGKVLKGEVTRGKSGALFRNILVTVQFAVSIFLIICTLVVYGQVYYAKSKDLGYDRTNIVHIDNVDDTDLNLEVFRQELMSGNNRIIEVMPSSGMPTGVYTDPVPVRMDGVDASGLRFASLCASPSFFQGYDIDVLAGRSFEWGRETDLATLPGRDTEPVTRGSFMLNETAVKSMGITVDQAVGRQFAVTFADDWERRMEGEIVGVVADIHFQSLREEIPPVFFYNSPDRYWDVSIKIKADNQSATMAFIEKKWNEMVPNAPLDYNFIESLYDASYQKEIRQTAMFFGFAALAILIACLGLFGLASFTTARRGKEIAIRKVLGASVRSITFMLTAQFNKLVLLANLIAWPAAFFLMRRWLSNFAYRIDLNIFYFLAGAVLALLLAWLTVGIHSARAATRRPIHALRFE